jgi:hypothetical protein
MLYPAVRTNRAYVEQLRLFLNATLIHDATQIVQIGDISGAPSSLANRSARDVRGSMKT